MKIICIGRNYLQHINELNNKKPENPLFFLKPETAIQPKGHPFFIPDYSNDIHYEIELVLKINKVGKHIEEQFAHKYFSEIGIGIDFTARDIQEKCKKEGLPWEPAKGFDGSAQISTKFIDKKNLKLNSINFKLKKNNVTVQDGNSKDMIFSFNKIISFISKYYTLKIGDLIYTGTPSGVGKVNKNDKLTGYLNNEEILSVDIK
ncbi:MAG: 2-hydroxyhepta-2,4-diene-1,7-dioate isomerase [Flavobacteriales bacterium]|nr:2-hydroxyhepta-2,4-diene-1,7-dioate isomerase [Flavobacteriales bacterium]MBO98520.1 2-hydroxyhepta-2,4-diene-1,7-dioate isomerase [Flavobacteriales bacterium]|tara:strand:- start:287 stop:898 length:612 start_codon:yes stop_codon:yes gene_type:complete